MGDTFGDGDSDEKPVHEVCVDGFYMGKYEVTQGEYVKSIGPNPSHFKKGNDSLNFHAREFARTLDSLSGDKLFNGGVPVGSGRGKISVKLDRKFDESIAANFSTQKADHHILNIAYQVAKELPDREVSLVTKDVNLRMKAKAVGLMAQDYKNDHVADIQQLYTGTRVEEEVDPELISKLYTPPYEFPAADLSNPNADINSNGLTNNEARLWGFDPTDNSAVSPISVPLNAAGTFSYTRRAVALSLVSYEIWTSTDLVIWAKDDGASEDVASNTPVSEVETVSVTLSATPAGGKLFAQVRASE